MAACPIGGLDRQLLAWLTRGLDTERSVWSYDLAYLTQSMKEMYCLPTVCLGPMTSFKLHNNRNINIALWGDGWPSQ